MKKSKRRGSAAKTGSVAKTAGVAKTTALRTKTPGARNGRSKRDTELVGIVPRPSSDGVSKTAAKRRIVNLALVQFAPRKGDVAANFERIEQAFSALHH